MLKGNEGEVFPVKQGPSSPEVQGRRRWRGGAKGDRLKVAAAEGSRPDDHREGHSASLRPRQPHRTFRDENKYNTTLYRLVHG